MQMKAQLLISALYILLLNDDDGLSDCADHFQTAGQDVSLSQHLETSNVAIIALDE